MLRIVLLLLAGLHSAPAFAQEPVDYLTDVKPILAQKCFACHGALKQESGLRLDAASLIRQGGDGGLVIVAGKIDESPLITRISAQDPQDRMPPADEAESLTAEQIAILKAWVRQGAIAANDPIPADPRAHWAYQVPERSAVPQVEETGWVRNDIDAFLAAEHERRGLVHTMEAAPETLLRRVYYDLIGLPPTREELHAFLRDDSAEAYERVVDRLLDSPQYGERWGRHWMDVWRYSDWAGFSAEIRYSQRHIWRWRDWIVESLNADKGYDRMILEMLAADELTPGDDDAVRGTGFLARNWYKFDRNSWLDDTIEHTSKAFLGMTMKCARCHDHKYDPISQREYYRLRAIFEPYDVRTDRLPGVLDTNKDGLARVYDARPEAVTYLFQRGDPNRPDKEQALTPGVPGVIDAAEFEPQAKSLLLRNYYPAMREFVARDMVEQAQASIATAEAELAGAEKKRLETNTTSRNDPPGTSNEPSPSVAPAELKLAELKLASAKANLTALQTRIAAERAQHNLGEHSDVATNNSITEADRLASLSSAAAKSERLAALAAAQEQVTAAELAVARTRDTAAQKGDAKSKQAVTAATEKLAAAKKAHNEARSAAEKETSTYQPLGPTYPKNTTGRRLALAGWIVDRRNPLTARVAVNHIWLRHFGRPLVKKVDDFGLRSPRPALVELLDYLAVELMEHDWGMKRVHRLIVSSSAYRMSSTASPSAGPSRVKDIDNEFFWRMNARRMEAEAVRDSLLYFGGSLDLTRGGPDIDHKDGLTVPRRSLYFQHARERQVQFLQMFDAANPRECYRRQESIRPQQAFALVNSSLALAQSRRCAQRPSVAGDRDQEQDQDQDQDQFIVSAFETILSRRPSKAELAECQQFLALQSEQLADPTKLQLLGTTKNPVAPASDPLHRARENFLLVLFNHNDFVSIR